LVILRRVEKLRYVRWSDHCQKRPDRESQKDFIETESKKIPKGELFSMNAIYCE
jgi:hypothetical protein